MTALLAILGLLAPAVLLLLVGLAAWAAEPGKGWRQLVASLGPSPNSRALLNPAGRVGVEFFTALCGFPGIGWLASGRVVLGLVFLAAVPGFVWALCPALLCLPGLKGPLPVLRCLPALALLSGGGLCVAEVRHARHPPSD